MPSSPGEEIVSQSGQGQSLLAFSGQDRGVPRFSLAQIRIKIWIAADSYKVFLFQSKQNHVG